MARRDAARIAALPRGRSGMAAWQHAGGDFWAEVAAKKDELRTDGQLEPALLANLYERARGEQDELESRHKAERRPVTVALAAIYELIPEVFEATGVENLRTRGGHVISTSPDITTSVSDQDALVEWARANGYERKLTLPAPTVRSIAMERLRAGEEFPAGVEVRGTTRVNFRKV